jgi:hypothetical protein
VSKSHIPSYKTVSMSKFSRILKTTCQPKSQQNPFNSSIENFSTNKALFYSWKYFSSTYANIQREKDLQIEFSFGK